MQDTRKHFFISYNKADRKWAEWIAWQLEEAGYTTVLQAWDFQPGSNFILQMNEATKQAERTLIVLSPDYLSAQYTQPEWADAFRRDPQGEFGLVLPVRVRECELTGLLAGIVYIDLVGQDEAGARERLLAGIRRQRAIPTSAPQFPLTIEHVKADQPSFPPTSESIWNVPYRRNPFFTGQETLLTELHTTLNESNTAALTQPQAISGLGGIGKTQIALEYAYRHEHAYRAVLWVQADTHDALISGYSDLAKLLNLPQKDEQDQQLVVEAMKHWLETHEEWLLILDNADELALLDDFLPRRSTGHILLTTRAQYVGTVAHGIEVEPMDATEGSLLLLRRAKVLPPNAPLEQASEADRAAAREIVQILGGLPLALDQAAAYIDETECGLSGYLTRYGSERLTLLRRRGKLVTEHPEPVAATWSLSFAKVEAANPAAADLLRLCAFMHPDAIPEEVLSVGAPQFVPSLQVFSDHATAFDAAIASLRAYSLLRRNPETKTLSLHRLVQAVLKDSMDTEQQRQWATWTIFTFNKLFPNPEFVNWPQCERYLLHAQSCCALIDLWNFFFPEAAHLLNQAGTYLQDRGRYKEAEPFCKRALTIRERLLGTDHPQTATSLNNLAALYWKQGKYTEAEPLLQRSLAIYEQQMGRDHLDTATSLNNLALLYKTQGKYIEAEQLYQRALAICEKQLGTNHPDTAQSLNNLAGLYRDQGKYEEAEPLYQRTLAICEQQLGTDHRNTATSLENLATLYWKQGKYAEAESLMHRSLAIYEQQLGTDHPYTVNTRQRYDKLLKEMQYRC